ncbi:hypothetical protein OG864_49395 [Streptomyces sp. NBC_00124]|uniref:hypothetical protein n=1 Tax=Streptomyces sp. NBC_00124 TaxID=2975662 RepID=UPI002253CF38|nr:hypothetical protein [Streptomyces sp. NBC_00124]MCX5366711.1 hypothetical protein [Streptomyces sp. NBC_00124]
MVQAVRELGPAATSPWQGAARSRRPTGFRSPPSMAVHPWGARRSGALGGDVSRIEGGGDDDVLRGGGVYGVPSGLAP